MAPRVYTLSHTDTHTHTESRMHKTTQGIATVMSKTHTHTTTLYANADTHNNKNTQSVQDELNTNMNAPDAETCKRGDVNAQTTQ